jgi:flagellin
MDVMNGLNAAQGFSLQQLNKTQDGQEKALDKIGAMRALSGTDSANLQIADSLRSNVSMLSQGVQNANEAVGMLQIADSALESVGEGANKLQELSVQMGNGALNDSQRSMLQKEADGIKTSMQDAIEGATYNGKNVFSGQMEVNMGNEVVQANVEAPKMEPLSINDNTSVMRLAEQVSQARGNIGSATLAFDTAIKNSISQLNQQAKMESQLQDSDVMKHFNELNHLKLQENATAFSLSHNTDAMQKQMSYLLG